MASTQRARVAVTAVLCYSVVRYLCGLYLLWIPRARESGVLTNIVWNCMYACCVCFCLPLCVNAVRLYCPLRPLFSLPPPPLRSRSSLVVGPRGPTRCVVILFASVPVSSRCTLLKLHLALSLLVVACTFSILTSHCRLTCIGCLVHSLPLSVMVNTPFPYPPSTDCHPGIIVNSKFCRGRLWGAKDCYI